MEYIPPVSYAESFTVMKNYDVSLIIEAACEEGIFLPSKVADYLQINSSIFAVSPQTGVLRDLYENGVIGYCANVRDADDIERQLERIVMDFNNDILKKCKNRYVFSQAEVMIIHNTRILV